MTRMRLTTYKDVIDHLADYLGGASDGTTERLARRAIQNAYQDLPGLRNWSYFYNRGRIVTSAPQSTGTVIYTQATRTVTLTGATWPSWVTQGVLAIGTTPYAVASNPSSTTIVLATQTNPGKDVASSPYTLFQDSYTLPIDFVSADSLVNLNNGQYMKYAHLSEWLEMQRIYRGPALPYVYSITGSPNFFGAMSVRFFPPPDQAYPIDFVYKRRPRQMNIPVYGAGTCATTSGSLTVTGTATTWTAAMIGSVIRFSAQGDTVPPSGPGGQNPTSVERTITGVTDVTHLTVDVDPGVTLTTNLYAISDPVDIEEESMLTFFYRECEKQLRSTRRIKPTETEEQDYRMAMALAFEADARSTERQAVGQMGGWNRRFKDYGSGPDQG